MNDVTPLYYDCLQTDIGELVLAAGENGLQQVFFHDHQTGELPAFWEHDPAQLADAVNQLRQYFSGKRQCFDLPLAPHGTSFQIRVWKALREIPYGDTVTYGELAERVDSPKAYRAVGNANGKNPLVIIQPCHRVVASGGQLGVFLQGFTARSFFLAWRRVKVLFSKTVSWNS